jgi:hypothetical protein
MGSVFSLQYALIGASYFDGPQMAPGYRPQRHPKVPQRQATSRHGGQNDERYFHGQYQADHEGRQRSTDRQRTLEQAQPGDDCQRRARGRRGGAKDVSGPNRTLTGENQRNAYVRPDSDLFQVSEVFEARKQPARRTPR